MFVHIMYVVYKCNNYCASGLSPDLLSILSIVFFFSYKCSHGRISSIDLKVRTMIIKY